MMRRIPLFWVIALFLPVASAFGQTGKVAGTVTDAETGAPIPGVNVVISGTQRGASTNPEGAYSILNVSPGTYAVRATFVGYAPKVTEGVRVNIDLTTTVDIEMQAETVGMEEVVVQARPEVVQPDVSANVANLSAEDIANVPVTDVEGIITQQPGVQGLRVRGGQLDETLLNVDGYTMRDGINNEPISNISYTAIKELQVQTGGFNAEYGNVRSGLINVVTKEAPRDRYLVDIITKYSPASQKNFGISPGDPGSFYLRPYLDPEVAFVGTENGPWDRYEQVQYPTFDGWNALSERYNSDENPGNDLSPEELQEVFQWYHRKDVQVSVPDYTIDGSIGGPVPGVSEALGGLRFFGSYRQTKNAYLVPQSVDGYTERTGRLTLTSDLSDAIQLDVRGMYSVDQGMDASNRDYPSMAKNNNVIVDNLNTDLDEGSTIFANDAFSIFKRERTMLGAELTHMLSSKTFYEARVQRIHSQYDANPARLRDTSVATTIGGLALDEAPFGYWPSQRTTLDGTGMLLGGSWAESRDTSSATTWSARFDLTHQLTQNVQVKVGGTYIRTAHHRNNGFRSTSGGDAGFSWNRNPRQGAAYAQSKLEFDGLIANVGLRLDYFSANGEWYQYETYDERLAGLSLEPTSETLDQASVKPQVAVSPRLGVSFPISDNSKVFFNYGHFRQMLEPTSIYLFNTPFLNQNGPLRVVGNPEHPMPKTISYELGYEQNFFDQLLFRLTGYYKDVSEQSQRVRFISADGNVNYQKEFPYNYRDIRGFEALLRKNRGWYQGFINFTYDARKSGRFGINQYFENPVEQREYERTYRNQTFSAVPQPYVRANLQLLAPQDFGPDVLGARPLSDWRVSALAAWFSGNVFSWDGPGSTDIPEVQNNVRWQDNWNLDLRLAKNFNTTAGDVQFFVDVSNVLNLKEMRQGQVFSDAKEDYDRYMTSLHLPGDVFDDAPNGAPYDYIPGDDRPGDYREPGVPFVPIEIVGSVDDVQNPAARPLYYEKGESGGTYMTWRDGQWAQADEAFVDAVLEHKQYIDMPNMTHFTFLNPRDITLGLRLTF